MKTRAEILIALANGLTLTSGIALMRLNPPRGLEGKNLTPGSQWTIRETNLCYTGWEIYEEPNSHPKGTYQWAKEEHARGNTVKCAECCQIHYGIEWGKFLFRDGEFQSTDWVVVT